ncbi:rhamnulokinase [Marseilla massiliensis]|jgi:rhamnulokinase|uniref:Rhamnulokinase n=1 Tax=Marseilla massiliensis TaxID=1841864 RepID=A0A938WL48_9BACT|nr:rhamnulokinase family protein [Marseilla massiliensis]MBM6661054.1 rhamnulokinase [Marseilla massiliensis]
MEDKKYFFAVDLGATSGRTIIGTLTEGKIELEELTRFDNNLIETGGHFYWDIYALYFEIIKGLKLAAQRELPIRSIGIDTWGVDFVCVGKDGALLRNPLSYRDPHTFGMMEDYFERAIDKAKVYDITGIQFMNFNSLFQLYAMRKNNDSALAGAEKILFVPDALSYMLTGKMVCEYTIASTSQMLDPRTKQLDEQLLASVGLSRDNFGRMVNPATEIGVLTKEVQQLTGLGAIPVIAVAGHDTGSAVAAVPAKDEKFAYLSSGTWSLMGIETRNAIINDLSYERNFTNEGGIDGTTRFLKNICGMWLYERCRKEWTDAPKSHTELIAAAMEQPAFQSIINPDDPMFANPASMVEAIKDYCRQTGQHVPEGYAEICRCIFESLALRYRQVFNYLREMASFPIEVLHIIGGGSLNAYLNQFTANSLGIEVLAGPQEGTAIGNIMLQAKASGDVGDIWDMRRIIAASIELKRFEPTDKDQWDNAYGRFLKIVESKQA